MPRAALAPGPAEAWDTFCDSEAQGERDPQKHSKAPARSRRAPRIVAHRSLWNPGPLVPRAERGSPSIAAI